ncbi:LPS translocon maturation chaperone LptM [Bartonella florencae]|uniref:LPS translocon maturation chaperone LptM n=1 Tax=Bartonella florencae TaxID=928210 RepID=UPI0003140509|nr:lipoprotein [Bartonella florencae]
MKIVLRSLTIVLLGGIVLVGCGRKGALEMPPLDVQKPVKGASIAKSEEDKAFILDRLIK